MRTFQKLPGAGPEEAAAVAVSLLTTRSGNPDNRIICLQGGLANFQGVQSPGGPAAQQQPSGALNNVLGDRGRLGSGLQPQLAVGANAPGNQLQVPGMPASHTVIRGSCGTHRIGTATYALILHSFCSVQPACACTTG